MTVYIFRMDLLSIFYRQTDFKEFEESPFTWATEEDLVLLCLLEVYGGFFVSMDPVNIFSGLYTASRMLLRLMQAIRTRKLNEGKEPCGNALDLSDSCHCCEGFKTAANVERLLGDVGGLMALEEDIRRVKRFAKSEMREALACVLPIVLPPHVLDIMLDYMESTFNTGHWKFLDDKEDDFERLVVLMLKNLYKKMSRTYISIRNHLFVNPHIVRTSSFSDLSRLTEDWNTARRIMREIEV